ncbi:MAG: YchF/TatD family DNA exonuclease [Gammaproteobacteria bacterium]|jgi:TatD DNase family protein|nr:YchF/TatD family DNA exonuclease [Gammaproteobacteria bacterium]
MILPQLIDSHCHLDFEVFDNDRSDVLQRARDNNISDIVIPGTEKVFWDRIKQLCKNHTQLHACYGLHPYWVSDHNKQDIEKLKEYIDSNRPVALGECGLDFRPQQADKKTQLYFFEAQLDIAESHQLPVVIHSVRATEAVIQTIKKFKKLKGMMHSYSGSQEQARQLIDLNFFISVGGSVTYDGAKNIKQAVKNIPLTSLLIETDAPDQPDEKNRGKRNEPAFIVNTVKVISEIRGESTDMIAEQTTINAKKLFAI